MYLLIGLIVFVVLYAFRNVHIDFKSFFKKGFKKLDNKFGIVCVTAKQGMGKTYVCVDILLKNLRRDKDLIILTNVKSFYDSMQKTIYHKHVRYYDNIFDIIKKTENLRQANEFTNIIIFFDEIFTCLNKAGRLKSDILSFLSQLRKRRILFYTTAQEWSEIHITFRRYVRFQVVPNMFNVPLFNFAVIFKQVNDGDLIHWDNDLQDFVAPPIELQIIKGNKEVINSYDTFETINMSQLMSTQ